MKLSINEMKVLNLKVTYYINKVTLAVGSKVRWGKTFREEKTNAKLCHFSSIDMRKRIFMKSR
jgi:hypothetical protein